MTHKICGATDELTMGFLVALLKPQQAITSHPNFQTAVIQIGMNRPLRSRTVSGMGGDGQKPLPTRLCVIELRSPDALDDIGKVLCTIKR